MGGRARELSRHEIGAARFDTDKKLDGQKDFVVQLITPVLEGGVFLVFSGVEVLESGDENARGLLDIEVKGATGNPNAFLGVRPKRAMRFGAFDATRGKVELRKP